MAEIKTSLACFYIINMLLSSFLEGEQQRKNWDLSTSPILWDSLVVSLGFFHFKIGLSREDNEQITLKVTLSSLLNGFWQNNEMLL